MVHLDIGVMSKSVTQVRKMGQGKDNRNGIDLTNKHFYTRMGTHSPGSRNRNSGGPS